MSTVHMSASLSARLASEGRPDRAHDLQHACKKFSCVPSDLVRNLIDAWLLYVKEHDGPPGWPVRLEPFEGEFDETATLGHKKKRKPRK